MRVNRRHLGITLGALGLVANVLGIAAFFGATGESSWRWIIGNPFWLIGSTAAIALGASIYRAQRYRGEIEQYRHQLESSQQDVRALLDMLYSDPRFQLVRYEGEMTIKNIRGDVEHLKTYVLTAPQPEREMTCYVEARANDDLDRIFAELENSCRGGTVRPGSRRKLYTDSEGVIVVGFIIDFDVPVHEEEHTVSMRCHLKKYFPPDEFSELIHMALPTKRSVLKFRFDYPVLFTEKRTICVDRTGNPVQDLGNRHFSLAPNELKWEMVDPGFQRFYEVSFKMHKPTAGPAA